MITSSQPTEEAPKVIGPQRSRSISPLLAVFLYLFIVFVGAAIVAPRFYSTAQFLTQEVSGRFWWISSQPFHRYVNRCLILLAIIALPAFFKALGIRSARELGISSGARHWAEGIQGIVWGFIAMAVLSAILFASKIHVLDLPNDPARWVRHFKNALLAASVVALLEEVLFRGALFGALRRGHRFWTAALISAGLYALLHFLEKPANPRLVEWNSGFIMLGEMLSGFTDWGKLIPAFFNLTILGVILALVYERTGALHFSIGFHASLVFGVKTFGFLTNPASKTVSSFWGSARLTDAWLTGLVLLFVLIMVDRTLPARNRPEE